ncbi:MAG: TRAP transporter substrate-binding protein [Aquisalimonadaceae bacterium]
MKKKHHISDDPRSITRRELLVTAAKYSVGAATLGLAYTLSGGAISLAEAARSEDAKRKAAKHVLTLGHDGLLDKFPGRAGTPHTSWIHGTLDFKDYIERNSNGQIYVSVHDGGELGSQTTALNKVQQGVMQGGSCSTQNGAQLAPIWNVIDIPYVIGDEENVWKLIYSKDFNDTVRAASEKRHLTMAYTMPIKRWIEMSVALDERVLLPEDLRGTKMRVTGSRLEQAAFDILPANPTPIAWSEVYSALKDGAIDGIHISAGSVHDAGMAPVIGQIVNTGWMYNFDSTFLNTRWLNSLGPDLKEVVMQGSFHAQKKIHDDYEVILRDAIGVLPESADNVGWKGAGTDVTFLTDTQLQAWKDYLSVENNSELLNGLIDEFGREEYETVKSVVAQSGGGEPKPWWT